MSVERTLKKKKLILFYYFYIGNFNGILIN